MSSQLVYSRKIWISVLNFMFVVTNEQTHIIYMFGPLFLLVSQSMS